METAAPGVPLMGCEFTAGNCLFSWLLEAGLKSSTTFSVTEGTVGFPLAPNCADAVRLVRASNERKIFFIRDMC